MSKSSSSNPVTLSKSEKKAISALSGIYALRMAGLFMILPVFSLYAEHLEGVTPLLMGIALGVYGLTQAAFQLPFGMASDRFGRKPVIALGLLIFAGGSVVAAMATTIEGVIIGRALQGAGAIAAAIMALTADLTREENRVKAMASIGMSIGIAFAVSLVAGPMVGQWIGVDGLFWLTGVLALAAIGVLYLIVPTPVSSCFHRDAEPVPAQFKRVLTDPELLRLDFGIFALHLCLTATFVVMPFVLRDMVQLPTEQHWWVYLPVMLLGMLLMIPFVVIAESKRRMRPILAGAVATLAIAEAMLSLSGDDIVFVIILLFLFFIAFNVLEATLPSMIVKVAPAHIKGTAMGVYSSSQFLGAFFGGLFGGWVYGEYGVEGVFLMCALVMLFWFSLVISMKNPRYLGSFMVRVGPLSEEEARHLAMEMTGVQGVAEAVVIPEDEIAYLKVDNKALDREALLKYRVSDS